MRIAPGIRAVFGVVLMSAGLPMVPTTERASAASSEGPPEIQRLSVPLTDPTRPVTLRAALPSGTLIVQGMDSPGISIEVSAGGRGKAAASRDGMKRVPNTTMGFTVKEDDNVVVLGGSWKNDPRTLKVTVPHRTSLGLSCVADCVLEVHGVEGEMELNNSDGPISARAIRGSVVAHSVFGDVTITFDRIDPDKAMSFVAFDGDVDVTFPADLRAELHMFSSEGEIYTDFDLEMAPPNFRAKVGRSESGHRVEIEQGVVATVGGGGPLLQFRTWYGDIHIRKAGE